MINLRSVKKKKKYRIVLNGLFTKKALVSISENGGGSAFREKWQKFRVVFYYFGARSISQLGGGGGMESLLAKISRTIPSLTRG